jgi:nitrite reductase/ring-hydroxylating ferredoxin subunit
VSADGWQWTFQDEGEIIICPWHHWQFDVKTVASDRYAVPTYDLQVEDGEIHLLR